MKSRPVHDTTHLDDQVLEEFFLSRRSIGLTKPLSALAGVLLGKTSLNSLYGLMGGLPQTANQFGYPDSAGRQGLVARLGRKSWLPVLVASLATAPNE
jgi:hypothetical protein